MAQLETSCHPATPCPNQVLNICMKLTYNELLMAKGGLMKMMNADTDIEVSRSFTKALRVVAQELETFDLERVKLVKKYAKHDDNGAPVKDENGEPTFETPQLQQECNQNFVALLNHEIEMSIEPIDVSQIRGIKIPGNELFVLEKLRQA
jgi:hypothetical protein